MPFNWLSSIKINTQKHEDYKLTSLTSDVLKIFLKTIIYSKNNEEISNLHFGFRNVSNTREALFSLNVLGARRMQQNLYASLNCYYKAFDSLRHWELVNIVNAAGIDCEDAEIITLYRKQRVQRLI